MSVDPLQALIEASEALLANLADGKEDIGADDLLRPEIRRLYATLAYVGREQHRQPTTADFDLLVSERQMSIQVIAGDHLLVCYEQRVEVFSYALRGGIAPNASPELCRRAVCDLLADAHNAGEYRDDFGAFARDSDLDENADLAWRYWLLSWECRRKFQRLLGPDYDLFIHAACAA